MQAIDRSLSACRYNACKLVAQGRSRVYIVGVRNDIVSAGSGAPFVWPVLPEINPTIGTILHGSSARAAGGGVRSVFY